MTLQPIRPIDVLQTTFITRQTRTGQAWGLSPSMAAACGLGRQFVRDGRVVAEQWSLAQQAVLLDLDQRVAVVEAFSVTGQQVQAAVERSAVSAVAAESARAKGAEAGIGQRVSDTADDVADLRARVATLEQQVAALVAQQQRFVEVKVGGINVWGVKA